MNFWASKRYMYTKVFSTLHFWGILLRLFYSTVTCKVLLNRPHSKVGQYCADRCHGKVSDFELRFSCFALSYNYIEHVPHFFANPKN